MKEIKYILRYVKEYSLYNNFKFKLKYFKYYTNTKTTQELLQKAPIIKHNFIFLRFISFPGETNQYYTPFQLFVYNQNKQFYKDMFVDFLFKNDIYERFVCRIDRNHITERIAACRILIDRRPRMTHSFRVKIQILVLGR